MAVNEIALLTLAWNLSVDPTTIDIQKYQLLNQEDQIKIQSLIEQKDVLPFEIETTGCIDSTNATFKFLIDSSQ